MAVAAATALTLLVGAIIAQTETPSPHLDPEYGVLRIVQPWAPRGSCSHCHDQHALETGGSPYPSALFAPNTNQLCYTPDGAGPCHQMMPSNYPLGELDRIPEGFPEAGYFEYNSAGEKIRGARYRGRWPGSAVYDDPSIVGGGFLYASPHRNDPDMPLVDPDGSGKCQNCHNPHGSESPFDMLVKEYRGIGGFDEPTWPQRYALCLECHSMFGPAGMNVTGQQIADYYDSTLNPEHAGHQITMNPNVALSWPAHIRQGDKLPCYDCHNAHGSRGFNGQGPNAYLISDERDGWYGLTSTKTDPAQSRRFCLGCHIPMDGVPGSVTVEGIVMNAISNRGGHRSVDTRGCFECHGSDYTSAQSFNVHNPGD